MAVGKIAVLLTLSSAVVAFVESREGVVVLEWSAPDGCPGGNSVLDQLSKLDPDAVKGPIQQNQTRTPGPPTLWAQGVTRELPDGRFQLELKVRRLGTTTTRVLA